MNTRSNGAGVGERLSIVSAAEPRMMLTLWMSPAAVRFSVATLTQWGLMSREVTTPSSGTARASQAVEYLQAEVSKTDSGRRAPVATRSTNRAYPPRVPNSRILFAPIERASRCKSFPWAGETAISGRPFALLFSLIFSRTSSLGSKNELW